MADDIPHNGVFDIGGIPMRANAIRTLFMRRNAKAQELKQALTSTGGTSFPCYVSSDDTEMNPVVAHDALLMDRKSKV